MKKEAGEVHEASGKLRSLVELLEECGILIPDEEQKEVSSNPRIMSGEDENHWALIFCQQKEFEEMIAESVLRRFGIQFLWITSAFKSEERFKTAEKFNNDSSFKVLLLTTKVGGLGLNLTGADTVIFMEHDWNP